jgi:hypothetical protein
MNMDPSSRGVPRRESIRHARRMSNWTAAALIAGTGTAAVALADQATAAGVAATGAASAAGTAGTTGASTPAAAGPRVTHSVATTTASGVTVTTTTRIVNGRTVVTRVGHVPVGRDD